MVTTSGASSSELSTGVVSCRILRQHTAPEVNEGGQKTRSRQGHPRPPLEVPACRGDDSRVTTRDPHRNTTRGSRIHFLQSGKHGARVLDEYSTRTTTTRLWGRVSGSPAPDGRPPGAASITAARRPSWHVESPTSHGAEMRITFEPSRVSSACIVQAYEQVVPLRRRPTGAEPTSAWRRRHHRPNV